MIKLATSGKECLTFGMSLSGAEAERLLGDIDALLNSAGESGHGIVEFKGNGIEAEGEFGDEVLTIELIEPE